MAPQGELWLNETPTAIRLTPFCPRDNLHYNPAQKTNISCNPLPGCLYSFGTDFVLGPSYFKGFSGFGQNQLTFQAPLSANVNATNVMDFVSNAYAMVPHGKLVAIALGNEVNGYDHTPQAYVDGAKSLEQIVINTLNLTGSGRQIFEVLDTASGMFGGGGNTWTPCDMPRLALQS